MNRPGRRTGNRTGPSVISASVTGAAHRAAGEDGQDACAYRIRRPHRPHHGSAVIAISDGLGSARRAGEGAGLATRAVIEWADHHALGKPVFENDARASLIHAAQAARAALLGASARSAAPPGDFACTLIVVLARGRSVIAGHIGDGAVVTSGEDGITLFSPPLHGEYVNDVTPLTSPDWESHFRVTGWQDEVDALALFSDGCEPATLVKDGEGIHPFEGFFCPLFRWAKANRRDHGADEALAAFLASRKMEEVSRDDQTLAILVP